MQEVLAVLGEGVEAAEELDLLQVAEYRIMVAMAQQEAMAEEGEAEAAEVLEALAVAAALD